MKLIPLFHAPIDKTKDGRQWDSTFFLSEKGKVLPVFMNRADFTATGLTNDDFLSQSDVKEIFEKFSSVDVSFDDAGHLDSVSRQCFNLLSYSVLTQFRIFEATSSLAGLEN